MQIVFPSANGVHLALWSGNLSAIWPHTLVQSTSPLSGKPTTTQPVGSHRHQHNPLVKLEDQVSLILHFAASSGDAGALMQTVLCLHFMIQQ
jgi:hypothetical protein